MDTPAAEAPAIAIQRTRFRSDRTKQFTESVIREMSRLAARHGAINLAQGFPDFAAPSVIKEAARQAITDDVNQYAITWGAKPLREAIAAKFERCYGVHYDPEREVTVCCGSTECMIASLMAVVNPGDEVIVFEPYYENYWPDSQLCGATRRIVELRAPDWTFDPEELRRAFSPKTKAIILNTPHNPTGKVFTLKELTFIAQLCQEFDVLAITDEIYEHIVYDGARHIPICSIPGMRDRTIVINSMSKTYSVTGWRVGWVLASADLTDTIRKVHDFLTVGAPAPLQQAAAFALGLSPGYYEELASEYLNRRNHLLDTLKTSGFLPFVPSGAYYIMADISGFRLGDDVGFVRHLIQRIGVAAVPGSSFFSRREAGCRFIRFCFCKKYETLDLARHKLATL